MIKLMDPKSRWHQSIILVLICALGFGNYFCYDSPTAIEKQIESAMSVSTSSFTSLYSWYSWPNVVICFFGGVLIDKVLGIRLGAIVFLTFLLAGQVLVAFGAFWNQFWVMQLGRFVYGLGGESLSVAQNTYIVQWFQDDLLNAVFGFQITVSRGGSSLAILVMKPIYNAVSKNNTPRDALGYTFLIAASTCALSLVLSVVLALLDKRAERILDRAPPQLENTEFSFKDTINFKSEFWMLTIICVTFYSTIFPFITIAVKFIETKWLVEPDEATKAAGSTYLIAAVTSPFIGLLVDKVGRNLYFLLISSLMVMLAHISMALSYVNIWVPIIVFGFGYSIMCCAIWPLVALIIPKSQLGSAYGMMQAIQNLGLGISMAFSGIIVDWKGYMYLELFFIFWSGIAVISTIILMIQDSRRGGCLNTTAVERAAQALAQPDPDLRHLISDSDHESD